MLKVLEDLIVLQERDRGINDLRRELNDIPNRKALVEARQEDRRRRQAEADDAWKKTAAAIKQLEVEIDTHKDQITRMLGQQFEVKSNEQYRTLQGEIAAHRQKIRALEDREIELMEESEVRKAALERVRAELKEDERESVEALRGLDERAGALQREVQALEAERAARAADVDADWRTRYERILQHHGDRAVVPVENLACGGCHMKLTPQTVQDARRAQAVVTCGYCGRLLYWKT